MTADIAARLALAQYSRVGNDAIITPENRLTSWRTPTQMNTLEVYPQ